jgi:UDP-N-acetylmuramyl tripeptide synthase
MRLLLGIWAGKLSSALLRAAGRGGTHVSGRIALRIAPRLIGAIAHPPRVVAVTGTNGKTTASNLLAEALALQGLRVTSNRNGSNLAAGVAMSLIQAVDWRGRSRADIGVFEMDERSARLVLPGLDPDVLLVTNLTRDSIKRNAHPEYVAWIIASSLPARAHLVLNADDLVASSLGTGSGESNPRVHFAVDRLPTDGTTPSGAAVDAAICPVCDHVLDWEYWRYNHIGKAFCPNCGFRAPEAEYRASAIDGAAGTVALSMTGDARTATLINDNIVNVYNEIAVAAALDVLEVPRDRIVAAFDTIKPPTTRFAEERIGQVELVRQLTKGLVGVACSRAFEYVRSHRGRKAVLLSIDELTDRTNEVEMTSWIYDADYEYLADSGVERVLVGGIRRDDHALRLAIAGVAPDRIVTFESETAAADVVDLDGVEAVFNLHSVHNATDTGNAVQARLRERLQALAGSASSSSDSVAGESRS